ncbi:hypothetical protein JTB14_006947 [Gonioctena quinquepunctata]|nr:hypothetical protein JTB14_006947 [Gonioctena quinquepunctata]
MAEGLKLSRSSMERAEVAEQVIQKRLESLTEELNVSPDEQFGCRQGYSTEMQILRKVDFAVAGFNLGRGHYTGALSLDVAEAFGCFYQVLKVILASSESFEPK